MSKTDAIVCGKLDRSTQLSTPRYRDDKIFRLTGTKATSSGRYTGWLVAANKQMVWFDGQTWSIDNFLAMAAERKARCLLVLTAREYIYLVEYAADHGLRVAALETAFPIFQDIKYNTCLRTNLDVLHKHVRKLIQLGISPAHTLSRQLSGKHLHSITRKLRVKNAHDRHFFMAYPDAYQEVFKLMEERPHRVIIALDFNAMYLDSMEGAFCNPSAVRYRDFRGLHANPACMPSGIYRVHLIGALPGFLLTHHPFRYKRLGKAHYFQMQRGETIEAVLHRDELAYFASGFERVEVFEGLVSDATIAHPLLKQGRQLYAQRQYHRRRGDSVRENLCKASLQHMHSATNQKRFAKKFFKNLEQVRDFVAINFAVDMEGVSDDEVMKLLIGHQYFGIIPIGSGYELTYLNTGATDNIFSLSAQVVANARLKLLKTLERFLSHQQVELCYANVDSIHLSVHCDEVQHFFDRHQDIISDKPGMLKVEAIADCGYWFDVGRYWLKKNGEVVLFKNKGLNHKAAASSFVYQRMVNNFIETPVFSYLHTYLMRFEQTLTYQKRLVEVEKGETRYDRFQFAEISEPHVYNLTEATERLASMPKKVALYRQISAPYAKHNVGKTSPEMPGDAATWR